ncbi:hypothetical protein SDC9_112860 [bioreactor metagenome]|uniref:Uncharacterized protein n=1 Tax=bioreactor metagenome TaxID=1076179 RepID=A0A645BL19_9ZZZZ
MIIPVAHHAKRFADIYTRQNAHSCYQFIIDIHVNNRKPAFFISESNAFNNALQFDLFIFKHIFQHSFPKFHLRILNNLLYCIYRNISMILSEKASNFVA